MEPAAASIHDLPAAWLLRVFRCAPRPWECRGTHDGGGGGGRGAAAAARSPPPPFAGGRRSSAPSRPHAVDARPQLRARRDRPAPAARALRMKHRRHSHRRRPPARPPLARPNKKRAAQPRRRAGPGAPGLRAALLAGPHRRRRAGAVGGAPGGRLGRRHTGAAGRRARRHPRLRLRRLARRVRRALRRLPAARVAGAAHHQGAESGRGGRQGRRRRRLRCSARPPATPPPVASPAAAPEQRPLPRARTQVWLEENLPEAALSLRMPGASEEELEEAEEALCKPLPLALRAIYRLCDGQELPIDRRLD